MLINFCNKSYVYVIIAIMCYLLFPRNWSLLNLHKLIINDFLKLCNLLLVVCYVYVFLHTLEYLWTTYYFDRMMYFTYILKYCELFNALLLDLNYGSNIKSSSFFQKNYYISSMIIWYLLYVNKIDYMWIPIIINSFIHIIIHGYYLKLKYKCQFIIMSIIEKHITCLQLIELLIFVYFYFKFLYMFAIDLIYNNEHCE